jgi:hypothetical protein
VSGRVSTTVNLALPKFDIAFQSSLKQQLIASDGARSMAPPPISPMTDEEALYVSDVARSQPHRRREGHGRRRRPRRSWRRERSRGRAVASTGRFCCAATPDRHRAVRGSGDESHRARGGVDASRPPQHGPRSRPACSAPTVVAPRRGVQKLTTS